VLGAVETTGLFGKLIAFLLFTGCRRTEAARMPRDEIKDGVWTLPAARNKTGVELARPLSKAAPEIIGSMPVIVDSPFVFTIGGRKPFASFGSHKRNFDKVSGTSGWVLHDLRRTCRSLMARAGVPRGHAERCLGHTIRGVEGTYNRHKYEAEMLAAYENLAMLIARILDPTPNERQLRGRG
jgi:integrase